MGGNDGMLSLCWNNHSSTFCHMLASLRRLERFTDVTISCDGEFYCVHKFVLSMCSDYFTKIFERTPCKHPVIILKDVQSREMEALLNYMYLGQVSVAQDHLPNLIKVAEMLQIKGLAVPDEPLKGRKGRPHSGSQWKLHKKPAPDKNSEDIYILENKPSTADDGKQLGVGTHGAHGMNTDHNKGNQNINGGAQACDKVNSGHPSHSAGHGADSVLGENSEDDMIRLGAAFRHRENSELTVKDLVDDDDEDDEDDEDVELTDLSCGSSQPVIQVERSKGKKKNNNRGTAGGPVGSCVYNRDGRGQTINIDTNHPSIEEIYQHGGFLRPHLAQVEGSVCDGNTDGSALSLSRHKYDKAHLNRTAFTQNLSQDQMSSDSQPGPSLLYGVNEVSGHRDAEGHPTMEGLTQGFMSEETFQNPYFLFSSEQNECMSPKHRNFDKKKRPYNCTQCSYSTSSRSNLVIHMRTHTGERPFSCPECSFSASFEYNLKVHMRTHTGEKPFMCPHCPVKFAQKSHLKNHIVTHTGEKPYVCEFCSMRFSRRSNLRRHLIKHQ